MPLYWDMPSGDTERRLSPDWRRLRSVLVWALMSSVGGVLTGSVHAFAQLETVESFDEEAGARLEHKLYEIVRQARVTDAGVSLIRLPEIEINAFLTHQAVARLPIGITSPSVEIGASDHVSVRAIVDLSAIRDQRERTWLDPLRYLGGQLLAVASGRVRAGNGEALLEIRSVTVGGIPVPTTVLQEVVSFYTRTKERPDGTRLDEPILLPYRITELQLSPGLAVVVQ